MQIRGLNLNSLVVFSSVYRNKSMTEASKELGMTQPGITQHVKNLESLMNVALFERLGKKLLPTKEADSLFEGLDEALHNIEGLLNGISNKDRAYMGTVKIGMPIEFGNTMVLPRLSAIRKDFPQVQFHITYGLPHELNSLILDGRIDFAFIDQAQLNRAIKTEVVYHENLILCCSKDYKDSMGSAKKEKTFFERLSYVDYQPGEAILRNWFERGFGFKKMKLSMASYCFDVQGMASLIRSGMGVGILPEHVFTRMRQAGDELHQFRPHEQVNNPISLAYLEQRWNIPLNQYVMTTLKEMIKK